MSIITGYDPVTLRARVDLAAAEARLAELGELRSLHVVNEKVDLLRLVGRLDDAWDMANQALRQARFTGDRQQLLHARIRRAQVQQVLGKLEPALVELNDCVIEARTHDWAEAEASALQQRGTVLFDLLDYPSALRDFRDALTLRVRLKSSPDLVDGSMIAIAIAESFLDNGEG